MRIRWLHRLVLAATVAVSAACAAKQAGPPTSGYIPDRIPAAEIAATTANTGLELVERLRPQWLRNRGPDSFRESTSLVVYVNSQPWGGVGTLRQLAIAEIHELQYLNGNIATQRFGSGHGAGAILVLTR